MLSTHLCQDVSKLGVESVIDISCHGPLVAPFVSDHGHEHGPDSNAHEDKVEAHAVIDVGLLKLGLTLPGRVPVPPADAHEDASHADGHASGQEDKFDPTDDIEGEHVDQCTSVNKKN